MKKFRTAVCFAAIVVNVIIVAICFVRYIETMDNDELLLAVFNICFIGILVLLERRYKKEE